MSSDYLKRVAPQPLQSNLAVLLSQPSRFLRWLTERTNYWFAVKVPSEERRALGPASASEVNDQKSHSTFDLLINVVQKADIQRLIMDRVKPIERPCVARQRWDSPEILLFGSRRQFINEEQVVSLPPFPGFDQLNVSGSCQPAQRA